MYLLLITSLTVLYVTDGWRFNENRVSPGDKEYCAVQGTFLDHNIWWSAKNTTYKECARTCTDFPKGCHTFNIYDNPDSPGSPICELNTYVPAAKIGCDLSLDQHSVWYSDCTLGLFTKVPEKCCNRHKDDAACDQYADSGECQVNAPWMSVYCAAACQSSWACDTGEALRDKFDRCVQWASWGECEGNNTGWMFDNCAHICTLRQNVKPCNISDLDAIQPLNTEKVLTHIDYINGNLTNSVKYPYNIQYECAEDFMPVDGKGKQTSEARRAIGLTTCGTDGVWSRSTQHAGTFPNCVPKS